MVDNWLRLKSETIEILDSSSESYFSMEKSQRFGNPSSTSFTHNYCNRMLQSSGPVEVNPLSDTPKFARPNDCKKRDFNPGNSTLQACDEKSLHLEIWDTSTVEEHGMLFDTENIKETAAPDLQLNVPNNQETAQELAYVKSCLPSSTKGLIARKPLVCDYQALSEETSECDVSCHMQLKTDKNFKDQSPAFSKSRENSESIERTSLIKSQDNSLNFEESGRVVAQDERKNTLQWLKCSDVDDPLDHDSSIDDETFFSVKSGSFYSRSSSPFSLDDHTDVEEYAFEEALEDLSSFSLYRQSPNAQIVPCADLQFPLGKPSSVIKNVKYSMNEQITLEGKSSIYNKSKQRNMSCGNDLSWVSVLYNDKETQTKEKSTQDSGVNTNPIEGGLFPCVQASALKDAGGMKNVEESKGASSSSLSSEVLLQRAVKAELQLVDVQRWLCWQMCWKSQQQAIEKQSFFNLNKEPSEQPSSISNINLSSALAKVEEKYQEMRAKIQSGTPLDALIPLTGQLTTVDPSTDNLLKDTSQHSRRQNVSDVPAEDSRGTKPMKNDLEATFLSCLDKCKPTQNDTNLTEPLSNNLNQCYVHLGNIASGVKEVELMDLFRKFHVSNVYLEESSLTSSYAVLTFSKSEEAEAAVREMDGKMLCGKKLKVRAIKTSNYNLSLAFQSIKSVAKEIPQDEKDAFQPIEPKEGFVSVPPKCDYTQPSQVPHDLTQTASGGTLKEPFVNTSSNKCSHTNTNQGMPAAPPCSSPSYSHLMAPSYQWMLQSQHSPMMSYSSMPNFMCVPFSYPLYTLPNHPPFQPYVTPSSCGPGINMKSNVNTQFGKGDGKPKHATPMKSIHSTDRQSNSGISLSIVYNRTTSSTDKTKIFQADAGTRFTEDEQAVVKSVNKPTSSFNTPSNAKLHSEAVSQDKSLKMPIATASVHGVETSVTECLASGDKREYSSGLSDLKSTAPLRLPTSVPPSVTIPEAIAPYVNPISSPGVLTPPPNQNKVTSAVTSQKGDSVSAEKMPKDWGVYPQLTSSEIPITVIPNQLNFAQFKRVVKYLSELHKDATRDQIVGTLEEIRKSRGGTFFGLTIPDIIFAVSSKLDRNVPPA